MQESEGVWGEDNGFTESGIRRGRGSGQLEPRSEAGPGRHTLESAGWEKGLLREAHERLRGIVFEAQDPETWVTEANLVEKT